MRRRKGNLGRLTKRKAKIERAVGFRAHRSRCRCIWCQRSRRVALPREDQPPFEWVERELVLPNGHRIRRPVKLYQPAPHDTPLVTAEPKTERRATSWLRG